MREWHVERADVYVERLEREAANAEERASARQLRLMLDAFACAVHQHGLPVIAVGIERLELFCGACGSRVLRRSA